MTRPGAAALASAFAAHPRGARLLARTTRPLVVAVSGGLDSSVLLHLLRFGGAIDPARLVAVHVDHRIRPDSADDARFVRARCQDWQVPLVEACVLVPPGSEAAARDERWHVLEAVARSLDACAIVTAHHRDDQAETVLQRVLRGTGLTGLQGILPRRGLRVRPLLPWSRAELQVYAEDQGIAWRHDATNDELRHTRNRLRHRVLPALEAEAPGVREALVRLADNVRDDAAALDEAAGLLLARVLAPPPAHPSVFAPLVLDREGLLAFGPALRGRVLRAAALRLGVQLDRAGTRVASRFVARAPSGSARHLTGGLVLTRDFARITLRAEAATHAGIPSAGVRPPFDTCRVRWAEAPPDGADPVAILPTDVAVAPFSLRAARPGDRMRLPYGTKKLKKLFTEARLDRGLRRGHPVVEDATGRIVWVPGVAVCAPPPPQDAPACVLWLAQDPQPQATPADSFDPESPES